MYLNRSRTGITNGLCTLLIRPRVPSPESYKLSSFQFSSVLSHFFFLFKYKIASSYGLLINYTLRQRDTQRRANNIHLTHKWTKNGWIGERAIHATPTHHHTHNSECTVLVPLKHLHLLPTSTLLFHGGRCTSYGESMLTAIVTTTTSPLLHHLLYDKCVTLNNYMSPQTNIPHTNMSPSIHISPF